MPTREIIASTYKIYKTMRYIGREPYRYLTCTETNEPVKVNVSRNERGESQSRNPLSGK